MRSNYTSDLYKSTKDKSQSEIKDTAFVVNIMELNDGTLKVPHSYTFIVSKTRGYGAYEDVVNQQKLPTYSKYNQKLLDSMFGAW